MISLTVATLGMLASIAPFGAIPPLVARPGSAGPASSRRLLWSACAVALAILCGSALVADRVLDALNVSSPTFQMAAGALAAPHAARLLLTGSGMPPGRMQGNALEWIVPVATPLLAGPASVPIAVSYGARFGEGTTIVATVFAVAVSGSLVTAGARFQDRAGHGVISILGRLSGVVLAVVALELAIDSTRSI